MELMEERGEVIEVRGNKARVKIKRSSACEGCKIDSLCKMLSQGYVVIDADNPIGARIGEKVIVVIYRENVLKASLILFGLPLVFLFTGAILGYYVNLGGMRNLSTFLGSLIFVSIAFIGIKFLFKAEPTYRPVITKVA